jgi:predicted DNA-binding protein (MmcQ/YjbR family)
MNADWIRRVCLAFPQATEQVQWGDHLVFKVAGKVFVIAALSPGPLICSFKVPSEEFPELTERLGIVQAPYLARGQWVAVEPEASLLAAEWKRLLRQSYDLVVAKLPKKTQVALRK